MLTGTKLFLTRWSLTLLLFSTFCLGAPTPPATVRADAGPELQGPTMVGSILSPYQFKATQVQMVAEQVLLRVEAISGTRGWQNQPGWQSQVVVTAAFQMQNTATTTERMGVVFPLTELLCPDPLAYPQYEHQVVESSFNVTINKEPVTTTPLSTITIISTTYPGLPPQECTTAWRQFNVTFPPKKTVRIVVNYRMEPTYFAPYGYPWDSFTYVLKTGAPWHGPIGQIDLTLELPYAVTAKDILAMPSNAKLTTKGFAWRWSNAEPTENIKIITLSPQSHQDYTAAAQGIKNKPKDPEAWLAWAAINKALAARYDVYETCHTGFIDTPAYLLSVHNWDYARAAVLAYKQALLLRPKDAGAQTAYAALLAGIAFSANNGRIRPEYASVKRAQLELNKALALDPNNFTAQNIAKLFQVCSDTAATCQCR